MEKSTIKTYMPRLFKIKSPEGKQSSREDDEDSAIDGGEKKLETDPEMPEQIAEKQSRP